MGFQVALASSRGFVTVCLQFRLTATCSLQAGGIAWQS